MKFFLLFFFFVFSYTLEINVDYSKDKYAYEVLTIKNKKPFFCKEKKNKIICEFDRHPSTPVFKTATVFFRISPLFKKNRFYLVISLKRKYVLRKFDDDLFNDALIGVKLKKAKKWVIVSGDKIPFIKREPNYGLNVYFKNSPKIYIGSIDENGNPINVDNQARDVIKYFEIKKAYERGKDVLSDIDDFVKEFPDSVFLPDIEFLKMKILDSEDRPEDVISLGKKWIKKYAFNENLPKVLLLMGKNYTKLGFMSDASYFYQRIINEYPGTEEAYLAMIYWADQMYVMGESKKAFELYKKALYSTKDVEVASLAAVRLAQRYMDKGDIKTAFEYYKRVYRANKNFILKDKNKAFELAKTLASHRLYSLAIEIGEDLLKRLKKLDDLYEPLEYYLALWSYDEKNYKKTSYWINRYLKEFPYGDYSDKLASLRDKILFEINDVNISEQLTKIDEIIEKYKGQSIAKKALDKKIMLLYKLKEYEKILKMAPKIETGNIIKDGKRFIKNVARKYVIKLLNSGKCAGAIRIMKKFSVKIDDKYDEKLYECAIKSRNFGFASSICNKYLNSPDDKIFIVWMKRKIEALEFMGDYKGVVIAVDDLCRVMKKGCYKYRLKKFFALWNLKKYKEALKEAEKLGEKKDIKNCDVFIKIVNFALKNGDYLTAALYAKKIIELQNHFDAHPYSPFAEFTFAKYTKNKKDAEEVLKKIIPKLKGENLARAYYMLANITGSKIYLQECLKVKNSKMWKNLCKEAMSLF
ncbi:tetratricopeptide repeat protein [Nautilia sp.]